MYTVHIFSLRTFIFQGNKINTNIVDEYSTNIYIVLLSSNVYVFFKKSTRFPHVEKNSSEQNTFHPFFFFLCNFRNYESAKNLNYSLRLLLLGVAISFVNKE